jgi:hypothetical protein
LRATRAYITSFGTTGLLIASALMTLAVMSAFVAFNGFPGQDVQDPIGTLLVQEKQASVKVPAKPVHVHVAASRRGPATTAATRHRRDALKHTSAPRANTGPLAHRAPTQTPSGSQTQTPGPTQNATSVAPTTPTTPIGTTTPSVPDPGVSVPPITLPSLPSPPPPPSGNGQLPVDPNSVTGIIGSP